MANISRRLEVAIERESSVITGHNTDIEYDGITYHVQTEDKGLKDPLVLSLVYVGGTILASKRTDYQDLIDSGFEESLLTERLQRQHKLICAAIRAGRIEDLKRMSSERSGVLRSTPATVTASSTISSPVATLPEPASELPAVNKSSGRLPKRGNGTNRVTKELRPIAEVLSMPGSQIAAQTLEVEARDGTSPEAWSQSEDSALFLSLLDAEDDFRAGQLVTIRLRVSSGAEGEIAVPGAEITVKVLGTTFRPLIFLTSTNHEGIATVRALLPRFMSGRAAMLIRAKVSNYEAELRRIINHA